MKSGEGGVQFASGPIRKVGGGVQFASGPIRKVGGGGAVCFKSDTKSGGLCLAHSKYVIVNN